MAHAPGQVEHVPKVGIADGVTQRCQPELTALATATLPNVTPKRHARPTADYEFTAACADAGPANPRTGLGASVRCLVIIVKSFAFEIVVPSDLETRSKRLIPVVQTICEKFLP